MLSIFNIGKHIIDEIISSGRVELLIDLFNERTKEWKYFIICDEFGTVEIFYDLKKLSTIQGFNLIPTAVEIVKDQKDDDLFTTALSLLLICIETSKTIEMPIELQQNWTIINSKVSKINNEDCKLIWSSIHRWYRINETDKNNKFNLVSKLESYKKKLVNFLFK